MKRIFTVYLTSRLNCFIFLVIGGLAWAITASSIFNRAIYAIDYMFTFLNIVRLDFGPDVDVEVDVFFQEEARLGDQM